MAWSPPDWQWPRRRTRLLAAAHPGRPEICGHQIMQLYNPPLDAVEPSIIQFDQKLQQLPGCLAGFSNCLYRSGVLCILTLTKGIHSSDLQCCICWTIYKGTCLKYHRKGSREPGEEALQERHAFVNHRGAASKRSLVMLQKYAVVLTNEIPGIEFWS